jgi:hypothetical protein
VAAGAGLLGVGAAARVRPASKPAPISRRYSPHAPARLRLPQRRHDTRALQAYLGRRKRRIGSRIFGGSRHGKSDLKGITQRELEAARTARAVRTARANARASELAGTIKDIQASGVTTLLGIATELNRHDIPTATGRGKWCGEQVRRVLVRLP